MATRSRVTPPGPRSTAVHTSPGIIARVRPSTAETGTGTPAVTAVLHWPAAITWHTHRREMPALEKQFYGYSAGLSAFYASTLRSRPAAALDVLRLAPHVIRDLSGGRGDLRSGHLPDDFPSCLLRAGRRGLLQGGFMYAYEAIRDRRDAARP